MPMAWFFVGLIVQKCNLFIQKHFLDCLKVAVPIQIVRLKITCFRPFIPRIDRYKRGLLGVVIKVFLRHFHTLFYIFRSVVFNNPSPEASESGVIVPAA